MVVCVGEDSVGKLSLHLLVICSLLAVVDRSVLILYLHAPLEASTEPEIHCLVLLLFRV